MIKPVNALPSIFLILEAQASAGDEDSYSLVSTDRPSVSEYTAGMCLPLYLYISISLVSGPIYLHPMTNTNILTILTKHL